MRLLKQAQISRQVFLSFAAQFPSNTPSFANNFKLAKHSNKALSTLKAFLRLGAVLLTGTTRNYGDIIDNFDGTKLDAAVWESTGTKSFPVADSTIT